MFGAEDEEERPEVEARQGRSEGSGSESEAPNIPEAFPADETGRFYLGEGLGDVIRGAAEDDVAQSLPVHFFGMQPRRAVA